MDAPVYTDPLPTGPLGGMRRVRGPASMASVARAAEARWSTTVEGLVKGKGQPGYTTAGVAAVSALDDGTLAWDEITASIVDAEPWPDVAGDPDVDGDGLDDLLVVRADASVQLYSGADLDALDLPDADARVTLRLPESASFLFSAVIADVDGDGHPDVTLDHRTLDRGAADAVFLGPLVGSLDATTTITLPSGWATGPGGAVVLDDLDADGRADLGLGHIREGGSELSIFLGATLAGGGSLDLDADRFAVRTHAEYLDVAYTPFAADLDADGTTDLALWTLDPTGTDGVVRAHVFASEIYLGG